MAIWLLVIGYEILVIGDRLLAIGFWLLAIGYWRLAMTSGLSGGFEGPPGYPISVHIFTESNIFGSNRLWHWLHKGFH